jgi:predicted membrane protein
MDADRWERKRERWERRWEQRMERRRNRWSYPGRHLFAGVVFIAIGLLFLFGNMGFVNVGAILRFWPFLLIAAGFFKLAESRGDYRTGSGIFLIVIGSLFLLGSFHIVITARDFWPVMLIGFGCLMLWRSTMAKRERESGSNLNEGKAGATAGASAGGTAEASREEPPASSNSILSATAILGGVARRNNSPDFRGGDITAIMGGCEIDLRAANITPPHEATLEVFAMWGGIVIKVPPDWTVIGKVDPILGGYDDKTIQPKDVSKRFVIRGSVIMGGIEVKN